MRITVRYVYGINRIGRYMHSPIHTPTYLPTCLSALPPLERILYIHEPSALVVSVGGEEENPTDGVAQGEAGQKLLRIFFIQVGSWNLSPEKGVGNAAAPAGTSENYSWVVARARNSVTWVIFLASAICRYITRVSGWIISQSAAAKRRRFEQSRRDRRLIGAPRSEMLSRGPTALVAGPARGSAPDELVVISYLLPTFVSTRNDNQPANTTWCAHNARCTFTITYCATVAPASSCRRQAVRSSRYRRRIETCHSADEWPKCVACVCASNPGAWRLSSFGLPNMRTARKILADLEDSRHRGDHSAYAYASRNATTSEGGQAVAYLHL
ncbi:hypothetical protein GGS23DRAFT_288583 [Durotheca rogersii]|uniref:uncharacterized protein n=1 Tax=Durotheca rogersii TaxID=419775 RepID=UPI00221FC7E1|nr:uncharacterized protein GGS23DRAFT_288583 [Durotheca rogersii]KAI5866776.1 hypothetical protein GGS23DRAFT_288583 [Durotheca rogersii]